MLKYPRFANLAWSGIALHVPAQNRNNTLFVRDEGFAKKEQMKLKEAKFIAKERERFTFTYNFKFNSGII